MTGFPKAWLAELPTCRRAGVAKTGPVPRSLIALHRTYAVFLPLTFLNAKERPLFAFYSPIFFIFEHLDPIAIKSVADNAIRADRAVCVFSNHLRRRVKARTTPNTIRSSENHG